MPLSTGQVLNNRYRIDSLLGQGGMGAVYRAWDWNLDMQVAIKENLDASPRAYNQFSREAQILSRLHHPNLPRVTDYFFVPGEGQYLVMDFAEGEDLQTMLDRTGVLPEPQVISWMIQVCDALSYLHEQPSAIIHRDIKPANIKVQPNGRVMLVDFGIAKFYDPHMVTLRGARAVTPGYSPPEQYGAGITDARSDVYALGATMYHMLTGRVPPESVRRMVGSMNLVPPHELNPTINPAVEQAVLKATAIAIDDRFAKVGEFRAALTQVGYKAIVLPPPRAATARPRSLLQGLIARLSFQPSWGLIGVAGLALALWAVLAFLGAVRSARLTQMPTITPTSAAVIIIITATPAPTEIPTATPIPPTPTATLPPPTETPIPLPPTSTPTQTPRPTPTPAQPELVSPTWGGGPYRNPVTFSWRGSLSAGQAYQVSIYNIQLSYRVAQSPLLKSPSWVTALPDKSWDSGEYLWRVAVVSGGGEVITSAEWTFWYAPTGDPQVLE